MTNIFFSSFGIDPSMLTPAARHDPDLAISSEELTELPEKELLYLCSLLKNQSSSFNTAIHRLRHDGYLSNPTSWKLYALNEAYLAQNGRSFPDMGHGPISAAETRGAALERFRTTANMLRQHRKNPHDLPYFSETIEGETPSIDAYRPTLFSRIREVMTLKA